MAAGKNCFGVPPFFFRKKLSGYEGKEQASKSSKASKNHKQMKGGVAARSSCTVARNYVKMTDLQNKILTFRDLVDLSPCITSATTHQLMIWTLKDLSRIYTNARPSISISELERSPMNQVLNCFCGVLKSIGDLWTNNGQWMVKCKYNVSAKLKQDDLEQQALALLEDMNNLARERMFDMMDEDEQVNGSSPPENAFGDALSESYSESAKTSMSSSPDTPTSVLPEISNALSKGKNISFAHPLLLPLRVQAVEKLNPIDLKRLSFHMFSHAVAEESNLLNQKNETEKIQKIEVPAKYESEVTVEGSDEANLTFEMEEEISMTALDESENNNGGDWTGVASAKRAPDAGFPANLDIDDFQPPPSLRRLRSKASKGETPPPEQSALLSPNGVPSPKAATASPPPPPPMFSPTKVQSQSQPRGPSLEPISQSPDIPQNLKTGPPPPPPPPMTSSSTLAFHPPPPIKSSSNMALPPTPPPPPPPIKSSSTMTFPPPPPPPPPMTSTSTMASFPPSPPPTPMASRIITGPPPPPPPSTLGNFAPPPHPPSQTMATGNMAPPPPPPPIGTSNRGVPAPPPPMSMKMGGGPPPPPGPAGFNNLRPKKAVTKLKRSSQMGQLYRLLKGKLEGSSLEGKTTKKGKIGASSGGKQGMADALAEMAKRSTYFQQIEEDVKNHAKSIKELKVAISSFKNSDMSELQNFHRHVESHLEKLTDETQVLSRFEDFPTKKLEALRMAASLYSKLDDIATTLKNWKIESPVNQLLDKIDNYFNKIKVQLDALERTKDEESKKFQGHNIQFDFSILIGIKELMVDVSSSCMELALKEGREAKIIENTQNGIKSERRKKGSAKLLWKAFQFAYRVYTFAGGYDDRADKLTRELAQEIETNPGN